VSLGRIADFALERYFARWEFAVRHQLSASDVEPLTMAEVLAMADADAKARWDSLTLAYTESAGLPALRAEIASMYERVEPSGVLVFAGAEEAVYLTALALLGPDADAVVVTPAYQSLHEVGRAAGARVHLVPLEFERGFELDLGALGRAVTPRTRMIVVNFPHNPTGAHISRETQRRIVELAQDAGAVLFSDEVYRGLEYRPDAALPPAADLSPTALSLGVMSKSFALPGLRIGWIATRNLELLDRLVRLKDYTTICSSAPSEILALAALRVRDRVLERSRAIVKTNVEIARRFFDAHADVVEWVPPRAGSVALPRFRSLAAEAVSTRLAEQHSVLLMPGSVFGAHANHFRLGLGRKDFPAALDALGRVLQVT
jgi:aspartate/methionine/tyrosine aminotransferase